MTPKWRHVAAHFAQTHQYTSLGHKTSASCCDNLNVNLTDLFGYGNLVLRYAIVQTIRRGEAGSWKVSN